MTVRTVRLKTVADVVVSNVDKHSIEGEPVVRLCNYVDVYKNTYIDANLQFMESTASEEQVRRYSLRAGDVVITKDSETPFDIAVPALVTEDIPGLVCGYHLAVIRTDSGALNPRFLLRVLQAKTTASYFANAANGITRYGLTYYSLKNVRLPVPTLSEQERIADFLDGETAEADALVAKYEQMIELLEEKRVALITQAVTKGLEMNVTMRASGVEWLGAVPKDWEVLPLRRVLSTHSGNLLPADIHEERRERDIAVYGSTEVIGYTAESPNLSCDSILLARVGQYAGKVSVARAPGWVSDNALIVTVNRSFMSLEYAALLLRSLNLNDYATKTAQPLLTGATVRAQIAPVPPLGVQTSIVSFVVAHDQRFHALKNKAQQAISLLREHRSALITAAVTGQINVTNYRSTKQPIEVTA